MLFLGFTRIFVACIIGNTVIVVVIERMLATYYIKNYEQMSRFHISRWLIIGTSLSSLNISIIGVFASAQLRFEIACLCVPFYLVMIAGFLFGFYHFTSANSKVMERIEKLTIESGGYNLATRYQLEENLRSLKLLRSFVTWGAFADVVMNLWICYALVFFDERQIGDQILMAIFELIIASCLFAFTPICLFSVPDWRRLFIMVIWRSEPIRPLECSISIVDRAQERDSYFAYYMKSW
ncbi:unnamed protein product, partial [Mesorhabditis belari]|uniref:G protein-coupled receptor n=1 Tax=Mesorhabditis belari TaxID=2138241 RepID=A0AAF3FHW1_9BILA